MERRGGRSNFAIPDSNEGKSPRKGGVPSTPQPLRNLKTVILRFYMPEGHFSAPMISL